MAFLPLTWTSYVYIAPAMAAARYEKYMADYLRQPRTKVLVAFEVAVDEEAVEIGFGSRNAATALAQDSQRNPPVLRRLF